MFFSAGTSKTEIGSPRLLVAPDLESLAADRGLAEGRDHSVGDALLDVHQREAFIDLDRADDTAGNVRLVGDGTDQVARAQPGAPPATDEEADPRPARAGAITTALRATLVPRAPGTTGASTRDGAGATRPTIPLLERAAPALGAKLSTLVRIAYPEIDDGLPIADDPGKRERLIYTIEARD